VDIPDEELLANVHQTPKSNNALLTLDDKDPRYNLDVLRERLSIFYANIDETKKFFSKKNIDVYKLRVPNTQNTYISDQNVFKITDKLIRNYSSSIQLC
jgi:beta-xylosidase